MRAIGVNFRKLFTQTKIMSKSSKSAENIQETNNQIIPKNEKKIEKNFNLITFISGGI